MFYKVFPILLFEIIILENSLGKTACFSLICSLIFIYLGTIGRTTITNFMRQRKTLPVFPFRMLGIIFRLILIHLFVGDPHSVTDVYVRIVETVTE